MKHLLKRSRFYVDWLGLVVYFAVHRRARVAIVDNAGRILLVHGLWKKWYDDDGWALPGGGVHKGEEPAAAVAREIAEELGIQAPQTAFELLAYERIRERGISYRAYLFKLKIDGDVPLKLQTAEIADAKWHSIADLQPGNLKPDTRRALELLAQRG